VRKYLIGAGAVLFPALLLLPNGQGFYRDWYNHVWMVGYFGEYFRQHGWFPSVVNTTEIGGLAFPVFYGYLFYPLLGLASTHLHPELVVRLACVLMFAAQYVSVRKTLRRLGSGPGPASAVACLTVWSVYGLTNLYNRSALTEFFAVGVLTCAVCSWFDLLQSPSAGVVWRRGLRFGLQLTLAMGFHPITGLFSLPLLVVLLCALPCRRVPLRQLLAVWTVTGIAAVVVLAPWVYTVRKFERALSVADLASEIAPLTEHIDHWQTRLNPLPYDSRCLERAPADVSTPYLDSQINWPLAILVTALAVAHLRRLDGGAGWRGAALVAVPLAYTAAMLYLSLDAAAFDELPRAFVRVQFLYRLVSYVNLGLLLVPLFLMLWAARHRRPGAVPVTVSPVLLCFALTYAGFCVVLKMQHAEAARLPENALVTYWASRGQTYGRPVVPTRWVKNDADRAELVVLPLTSCAQNDYLTPKHLTPLTPEVRAVTPYVVMGVQNRGRNFGENNVITVTADRPGFIGTEVLVFPWTRFEVDGQPVPAGALRSWYDARLGPEPLVRTAVPVPAGTHTIRCRFVPDRTWKWLHRIGWAVLIPWLLAVGGLTVARFARVRRLPALFVVRLWRLRTPSGVDRPIGPPAAPAGRENEVPAA
jgi:hypothetical protein